MSGASSENRMTVLAMSGPFRGHELAMRYPDHPFILCMQRLRVAALLCIVWPFPFAAAECRINPDILGAFYRIEKQVSPDAAQQSETLKLWRLHNEVAHERPERKSADIWARLSDNRIEHSHYNDSQSWRDTSAARTDILWSAKYQLLPPQALAKMELIEKSGEDCKRVEKYRLDLDSGRLTVWWNPALQLVLLLDRQGEDVATTMKLTAIETRGPEVAKAFNRRRGYSARIASPPAATRRN